MKIAASIEIRIVALFYSNRRDRFFFGASIGTYPSGALFHAASGPTPRYLQANGLGSLDR